jgi:hypothetical protein
MREIAGLEKSVRGCCSADRLREKGNGVVIEREF